VRIKKNQLITYSNELEYLVDTLPEAGRLNEISLTCNPDVFLEIYLWATLGTLS
jgi:hypothetical protein